MKTQERSSGKSRRRRLPPLSTKSLTKNFFPGLLESDFAVLSEDPTRVSPGRIAGLEVLATIVGGEVRYDAAGLTEQAGEAGAVGIGAQ